MKKTQSIVDLSNALPKKSVTVYMLEALDFVVPGEWENVVGFDNLVQDVTGRADSHFVQEIDQQVRALYRDPAIGYQRTVWLYRMVDDADMALAAAALADKVGQRINFLSFLDRLTPKADITQTVDLAVKLGAEIVSFCLIHGLPKDSIQDFADKLGEYAGASKMRMATLVCVDGVVPLGPDFARKSMEVLGNLGSSELQQSGVYQRVKDMLPGDSAAGQLRFLQNGLDAAGGWMNRLVVNNELTREKVTSRIGRVVDISDEALDYLGAFLDATTNYYEHTGIQTVSRYLIERAAGSEKKIRSKGPGMKQRPQSQ